MDLAVLLSQTRTTLNVREEQNAFRPVIVLNHFMVLHFIDTFAMTVTQFSTEPIDLGTESVMRTPFRTLYLFVDNRNSNMRKGIIPF